MTTFEVPLEIPGSATGRYTAIIEAWQGEAPSHSSPGEPPGWSLMWVGGNHRGLTRNEFVDFEDTHGDLIDEQVGEYLAKLKEENEERRLP